MASRTHASRSPARATPAAPAARAAPASARSTPRRDAVVARVDPAAIALRRGEATAATVAAAGRAGEAAAVSEALAQARDLRPGSEAWTRALPHLAALRDADVRAEVIRADPSLWERVGVEAVLVVGEITGALAEVTRAAWWVHYEVACSHLAEHLRASRWPAPVRAAHLRVYDLFVESVAPRLGVRGVLRGASEVDRLECQALLDHEVDAVEDVFLGGLGDGRDARRAVAGAFALWRAGEVGGGARLRSFVDGWEARARSLRGWGARPYGPEAPPTTLGVEAFVRERLPAEVGREVEFMLAAARGEEGEVDRSRAEPAEALAREIDAASYYRSIPEGLPGRLASFEAAAFRSANELVRARRGRGSAELIRDAIHDRAWVELTGLLVGLRLYHPAVQAAAALIEGRGDVGILHRVLYASTLGDAQRRALVQDYHDAYAGTVTGDGEATLAVHVRARLRPGWEVEKSLRLLDHALTRAEELYFVTLGIAAPEVDRAVGVIESVWSQEGVRGIGALDAEWALRVGGSGEWFGRLSTVPLAAAIESVPAAWRRVRPFFDAWSAVRRGDKDEAAATEVAEEGRLAGALRAVHEATDRVGTDEAGLVAACKEIGEIIARRRADPRYGRFYGYAEVAEVSAEISADWLIGEVSRELRRRCILLLEGGGKVRGADELHLLVEGSGGRLNAAEAQAALNLVTRAWGRREDLAGDAAAPVKEGILGDVLRPGFSIEALRVGGLWPGARAWRSLRLVKAMADPGRAWEERGVARLRAEIAEPGPLAPNEQIAGVKETLDAVTGSEARARLVDAYVAAHLPGAGDGRRGEAFVGHLLRELPLTTTLAEVLASVRGDAASAGEASGAAELLEVAGSSGRLDGILRGAIGAYEGLRRSRPQEDAARAQVALVQLARDARRGDGAVDRDVSLRTGHADAASAGRALLRDVRELGAIAAAQRRELAELLGLLVEVGGRALLVALTGPAGLAGLASALTAIGGSYALRAGLLGNEYDALRVDNVGSLLTEVSASAFEALNKHAKIAERMATALTFGSQRKWLRDLMETSVETVIGEVCDGAVERFWNERGGPSLERVLVKGASAAGVAGAKVLSDPLKQGINYAVDGWSLFGRQALRIWMVGPPPKAALVRAAISDVLKKVENPEGPEVTAAVVGRALFDSLLMSAATALAVGGAFARSSRREWEKGLERQERRGEAERSERDEKLVEKITENPVKYELVLKPWEAGGRRPFVAWAMETVAAGKERGAPQHALARFLGDELKDAR